MTIQNECIRRFVVPLLLGIVFVWSFSAQAITLPEDRAYVWGIDTGQVNIPSGSIITDAVLTIHNISPADALPGIYLLDTIAMGIEMESTGGQSDYFDGFGVPLAGTVVNGDLVIRLSENNDLSSHVWQIFSNPFHFTLADNSIVQYSSSLLELIDCVGNGNGCGVGIDNSGQGDFDFDSIELILQIESYQGDYNQEELIFSLDFSSVGLVGHWTLDDNSSDQIVLDASGCEVHGWSSVNTDSIHATGQVDSSFTLDGDSHYIDLGSNHVFSTDAWSVSMWMNTDSPFKLQSLVSTDLQQNSRWIAINNGRLALWNAAAGRWNYGNTVFQADQWYHVTLTYDGNGSYTYYVNGQPDSNWSNWGTEYDSGVIRYIGRFYHVNSWWTFDGELDDVRIYNRALTDTDVSGLYSQSGLVGHWKFDDNSSSQVVLDASGCGVHGTSSVNTNVISAAGQVDSAFTLDGDSHYIDLGSNHVFSTDAWSVSMWMNTDSPFKLQSLVSTDLQQNSRWIAINNGRLALWNAAAGRWNYGDTVFQADQWYHIALTYDGSGTYTYYVNGQPDSNWSNWGTEYDSGVIRYIGRFYHSNSWWTFDGELDDVRIYNRALADTDVSGLYSQSGLVGHWKFDDNFSNQVVLDASGCGVHGTSSVNTNVISAAGQIDDAFSLNGSSQYVDLGANHVFSTEAWSVSMWMNTDSPFKLQSLVSTDLQQNSRWIAINNGRLALWNAAAGRWNYGDTVFQADQWYHVALTYDGSGTYTYYVNGQPDSNWSNWGTAYDTGVIRYVGRFYHSGNWWTFDGELDDVKLYNKALTETEISELSMTAH